MKIIIIAILVILGLYFFAGEGSKEKMEAVSNVLTDKVEMSAVNAAGKSDVILEMAEKRIDTLRKRLIAVKSTKRSLKRKMENPKLSAESKENYTKLMSALEKCEKKGEVALLTSKTKLDELRAKLDVMDAEISIAKTSSKIMNESNPNFRNDELKKMIASLEKDLDDANAELDVAILEAQ